MQLKKLLYKVSLESVAGNMETEVNNIAFDSRKAKEGTLFVAVKGTQVDGHDFIEQSINKGAVAIICERLPDSLSSEVAYIQVNNSGKALGIVAANFYDNPSEKIKLVAVTGTNGKTTTVTLLFQLFRKLGYRCGMLSTVVNKIEDEIIPATHTTPDTLQINELLQRMINKGITHCFMEASSHAIIQERMAGLAIAGAIFTNISHDHLDYHLTFDAYIEAKKKLFDDLPSSAFALSNVDDKRGVVMLQNTKASKYFYALKSVAPYKARVLSDSINGLELEINQQMIWLTLIGTFNAYNILACYATASLLGEDDAEILTKLSAIKSAPGRFEAVAKESEVIAIVDYAHTPDALENVLKTINNFRTRNETVITVVGCGGNRDKQKRPEMASIATKYSDKVVLTSDNPRNEEPQAIIDDMMEGVSASSFKKVVSILDRKEAIKTAVMMASPNDIILVAGKGHETYQEVKGVKHHFDDREILTELLNTIG